MSEANHSFLLITVLQEPQRAAAASSGRGPAATFPSKEAKQRQDTSHALTDGILTALRFVVDKKKAAILVGVYRPQALDKQLSARNCRMGNRSGGGREGIEAKAGGTNPYIPH